MNDGPAVVLTLLDDVYFVSAARSIESARSVFGLKHHVRAWLTVHALLITMAIRPYLRSRDLLAHEWIVLWHAAVVVQAKRFAGERVELLRELTSRGISSRDVELSIRAKTNPTARVK